MAKHEQPIIAVPPKSGRRRSFSGPFKRDLVEQTLRADVSVAGVALANGLNTNLLARWRRDYLIAQASGTMPTLIPVHVVESQAAPFPGFCRINGLQRAYQISCGAPIQGEPRCSTSKGCAFRPT